MRQRHFYVHLLGKCTFYTVIFISLAGGVRASSLSIAPDVLFNRHSNRTSATSAGTPRPINLSISGFMSFFLRCACKRRPPLAKPLSSFFGYLLLTSAARTTVEIKKIYITSRDPYSNCSRLFRMREKKRGTPTRRNLRAFRTLPLNYLSSI